MMWLDVIPRWPLAVVALMGWGVMPRRWLLRGEQLTRAERLAWDFALGCGVVGFLTLAAGYAGMLKGWFGWSVMGIGLISFIAKSVTSPSPATGRGGQKGVRGNAWDVKFLLALTALGLLWQFLGSLTPVFSGDAMAYHMTGPREWVTAGRIVDTPLRFETAIPGHHMMIYTWALLMGGDVLCKLIQITQLIVAIVLIHGMARRIGGHRAGALAACLATMAITASFFRAPVPVRSDLTALMFATASIAAAMRFIHRNHMRWAAACGAMAGLTLATKYNAIPFLILPCMAMLFALVVHSPRRMILGGAVATAAALLAFSPWAVREFAVTGDPMYPLFSNHLKIHPDYEACREQVNEYEAGYEPMENGGLASTLIKSWIQRARFSATEGDFLVGLLLLLTPVALVARRRWLTAMALFSLVASALFAGMPIGEVGRFFVLTVPISATLTAWAIAGLARRSAMGRGLVIGAGLMALSVLIIHQVLYSQMPHVRWWGQPVMTRAAADEFIQTRTAHFEHIIPAYRWIDENLPEDAYVLCVNHPHAYHLPRRFWTSGRWNMEVIEWLALNGGDVTAQLSDASVTHILCLGSPTVWPESPGWDEQNIAPVWHEGDVWIYEFRAQSVDASTSAIASP